MGQKKREEAIFAGGCFWCIEPLFDRLHGVLSTMPGYIGGSVPNPTYAEVCSGKTGHLEAVKIVFDPEEMTYSKLLDLFWHHIDPLDPSGQFCDQGEQYHSAIFYTSEQQKILATKSKEGMAKILKGKTIHTQIREASQFYPAEEYHQGFYFKDSTGYKSYSSCSGRAERLSELWGKR